MKRALLIGAGTIVGTAAVLAYQPGSLFGSGASATPAGTTLAQGPATTTVAVQQDTAAQQAPVSAPTPAAAPVSAPQTFLGDAAPTRYGPVQVQITVEGGQVTSAVGQQAATDGHSQMIASVAIPQLQQQAVAAQSAAINGVSGASYTSAGFAQSLQSALQQAGLG